MRRDDLRKLKEEIYSLLGWREVVRDVRVVSHDIIPEKEKESKKREDVISMGKEEERVMEKRKKEDEKVKIQRKADKSDKADKPEETETLSKISEFEKLVCD